MSAGTITLTNNSDRVVGAGTEFVTNLTAGDMIVAVVGGVTYTLPVKSVESDTAVALVKVYDGPTQAGCAWVAVPRDTMNAITAQLAAETAKALRGLNYDKSNWQQVFSQSKDVTIRLPDGSTFEGPSWLKVADLLRDLDIESLQALADSVNTDAQQVSTDKDIVVAARDSANASAAAAAGSESNAATSASSASDSATAAAGSAGSAASSAASASADADRAAAANPDKALLRDSNLSDLTSVPDALENLGLSEVAKTVDGAVPIDQGGTGAKTAEKARENLELGDAITESNSPFRKNGTTYKQLSPTAAVGLNFFAGDYGEGIYWNTYGRPTLEYTTNAIEAPVAGGAFADWRVRGTGLLVSCPHAEISAHSIFKAVQWGRDWLVGFDVHYPNGGVIQAQLHLGGAAVGWDGAANMFLSNGVQSCTHYPDGNITGPVWAGYNLRGELHASGVSDRNHKAFIEPTKVNPMDYIKQMNFVQFGWTYDMFPYKDTEDVPLGVIAQDLQKIDPALVTTRPDGTLVADVLQVAVVALAAVKQLNERVTALEEKLAEK